MADRLFTLPRIMLFAALALAVVALLRFSACADGSPLGAGRTHVAPPPITDEAAGELPPTEGPAAEPMRTQFALIYYPSIEENLLVGEPREIFLTANPGDRAKQIVAELIAGPQTGTALPALPAGTRLRQIYVLDSGVAWIDFSADLEEGMGGGSASELLTVYSIVDSLALNISEIRRVGFLIEGKPVETLSGHVDLRRPLAPESSLIRPDTEIVEHRRRPRRQEV